MRFRLKSVLATVVTTGMLAGMLGFAQVAHAATTPPPFEPDPNARGCLTFYDASGNLVTSGSINTAPIAAYGVGDTPGTPGHNIATMFGARPEPGVPSQNWGGEVMSAGNSYPVTTGPAVVANSPNPVFVGDPGDLT